MYELHRVRLLVDLGLPGVVSFGGGALELGCGHVPLPWHRGSVHASVRHPVGCQ